MSASWVRLSPRTKARQSSVHAENNTRDNPALVDAHFQNTFPARLVIAEIAFGRPVDPTQNRDPGAGVAQGIHLFLIYVRAFFPLRSG
jgi:hypothetical protein